MSWVALHWGDIMLHLGLDLSGGFTLRWCMGICEHKRHQYGVWLAGAIFLSTLTVYLIG